MSVFHQVRRINSSREPRNRLSVDAELFASKVSFQRKADLMAEQARNKDAKLVVGYFPVVDDFNHAYFDLLVQGDDRAAALFRGCMDMVDDLFGRLMKETEKDELLVVSSDHGAMAHASKLHINEAFADAGIVRRAADGYDYSKSLAWYHPSDCGQVVSKNLADKTRLRGRVREVIDKLNTTLGANIGVFDGDTDSPFVAFLYPKGDLYFTGRPPRRKGMSLDKGSAGGHHLSPLSPTPWIQASLGLWSPATGRVPQELPFVPRENIEMKRFIMEALEMK
jgi:predicted AlkP superfamily pyrophosphatase or phosphodiesterase